MVMLTLHVSHFNGLLVLNARAVSTHCLYFLRMFLVYALRLSFALARSCALQHCTLPELLLRHFGRGKHGERTERIASTLCTLSAWSYAALIPANPRVLSAFVAIPLILAHPIASASLPSSWDALQGPDGWLQYGFTLIIIGGALVSSLMSSYAGESAHRASHALLAQLDSQAARAQGFLETAMPSYVAQALLSRVPDTELTVSCASATVAFIALTRFDELTAQLHPRQLMEVSLASTS